MERVQPCWSVGAPATDAGFQALEEHQFAQDSRERIAATRDYLLRRLGEAGIGTGPSSANFLLVRVDDAPAGRKALLQRGWVVRDCSSFGLADCIRVAIPRAEDAGDRSLDQ